MLDQYLPQSVSIVLVKTSHPGNVGSVARAMKTMGLADLRLVSPRYSDIVTQPDAVALASGAVDLLETARVFNSLDEALSDTSFAYALSARKRELGPALQSPAQAALEAKTQVCEGQKVAFVFGAERTGLTNDEILFCNRQVFIPSNPDYCSLNLSQAVQIVSYALRLAFTDQDSGLDSPRTDSKTESSGSGKASNQAVMQLREHWLEAMEAVDFLNPDKPRKVEQRLARLLARAEMEQEEVDMLRGFFRDVVRVSRGRWYPHEKERLMKLLEK